MNTINRHFSMHKTADMAREHAMALSADHPKEQVIVIRSVERELVRFYVEIDYGSLIRRHETIDSRWEAGKRITSKTSRTLKVND